MYKELDNENRIREEYLAGSDVLHSLEDLRLGAKGALDKLNPGRRVQLILSDKNSRYSYRAVLLDAQEKSETFLRHCGVIIVPKVGTSSICLPNVWLHTAFPMCMWSWLYEILVYSFLKL